MSKLWKGRTDGITNKFADDFNSSINVDKKLYKFDIEGSIAHAKMLSKCKIISNADKNKIVEGLTKICKSIDNGTLKIDENAEDIHMFIEEELTKLIGDVGKKVHTARSRNDQVALDIRMYLKSEIVEIKKLIKSFIDVVISLAKENKNTIMPGFTHLQKAQAITFSHYILSYGMMLKRDYERLNDAYKRIDVSPIGALALSGTTYKTDRKYEAKLLKFSSVTENSIDSVADRDFIIELAGAISIISMHLSRLSEEMIIWTSNEFNYIELSNEFTTGSSIMPQKKNSDMFELVRGKTGRIYGNLMSILTIMKGIPLAYNKDMQEDKELIFDSIDTIKKCLNITNLMLKTLKINSDIMLEDAKKGFINATDLADYLVIKGYAFRDAYKISGSIVNFCIEENKKNKNYVLDNLPIDIYKSFSNKISEDVYKFIDLKTCVNKRKSYGGTSPDNINRQISFLKKISK